MKIGELGNWVIWRLGNWRGIGCACRQLMSEQAERLKARTMQFALDVSELLKALPASELQAEGRELLAIFSATAGTARLNARSGA
jgi:hypothetical protein